MTLTKENAKTASIIENIRHPEWGKKRFNYNSDKLNDNEYCSSFGVGSNSSVLHESNFWQWRVVE